MAARSPCPHHRDVATHPGTGVLDRLPRSRVPGLCGLEEVKDVFCARCRPESEEVIAY
jgi:hypothetical protein